MGFLSSLCCISSKHIADKDDEKQPRPRVKPSRYNKHNLPSIVVEDPAPWVTNHDTTQVLHIPHIHHIAHTDHTHHHCAPMTVPAS